MPSIFARVVAVVGCIVLGAALVTAQTPRLRVSGDIKPPQRVVYVPPVYPEQARAEKLSGMVILELLISTEGKVLEDKVIRSAHPLLDDAASVAVRQWEFVPTLMNGEPAELIMSVSVNFTLRDDESSGGTPPPPPPPAR
jgi:TonB family protein